MHSASTDDFLLDTLARVEPSDPDTSGRQLTVDELEGVLDILDEEIFLIRRRTGEIVWMSPACRSLSHKLGATRSIDEFPVLKGMITEAIPDDLGTQVHARWHTRGATWEHRIGDTDEASVSVFCRSKDPDNVWVRFTRYSDRDEYFRQYVADHQKLFSTSSSLSVVEMATTLAHELNQPLGTFQNIVHGIRSRLEASGQASTEIIEALDLAGRQGRFASDILLKVRAFAKSREPVMEPFDVKRLIADTLGLLDWLFVSERINVNYNASDGSIDLNGDSTLLQQVLVNLLRNAVEAMADVADEARVLTISAREDEDGVAIAVRDSGHGLGEDHQEDLFTPFRSGKSGGMGVGLNICRSFVELHQGRFWFSPNPDRGCTAHILIPHRTRIAREGIDS